MPDRSPEQGPEPSKLDQARELLRLSQSGKLHGQSEAEQTPVTDNFPRRERLAPELSGAAWVQSPRHRKGRKH